MSPKPLVLSSLIALLSSGCATQEALTEQTRPLETRLDRVEQAIKAAEEADRARQAAFDRGLAALRTSVQALSDRFAEQETRVSGLSARGEETAARVAALEERAGRAEAEFAAQASATRKVADQAAEARGVLAERVAQAEMRLDELTTTARATEEAAGAERLRLDERLAASERRLDALAADLPERLAAAEQRIGELSGSVQQALAQATQEYIRLNGKEAFTVVLTDDKTLYPINSPDLGGQDVVKLDGLVERLAGLEQEYHIEIQGHTDNIGTEDYNYELGKARADVVKRYLHERKGLSLNRMSVISFGAGQPGDAADSRNRRIVARVLVLDKKDAAR